MDDDTYVNIVALVKLLRQYAHYEDWYLGKPSLHGPIKSRVRDFSNVCNCQDFHMFILSLQEAQLLQR